MSAKPHDNINKRLILSLICAAIFADAILYGIIIPIIPGYASAKGMGITEIGAFFALYPLTLLIFGIPAGMFSDRRGCRNTILIGMAGLGISSIMFGISYSPPLLFISRFLYGLSSAATWAGGLSFVSHLFPPSQRGEKIGLVMTSMGIGFVIGPIMGGVLYSRFGYGTPFYISALFSVAVIMGFLVARPLCAEKKDTGSGADISVLADPNILIVGIIVSAGVACLGMLEVLMPLYLSARFRTNTSAIGFLFGFMALAYVLSQPLFGRLSDRHGRKIFIITGGAITALLCLIITAAASFWVFVIVTSAIGISLGMLTVSSLALINDVFDQAKGKKRYGLAAGYFTVAYSAGMIIGPIAGSVIYKKFGFQWAFLCYSAALTAVVIYTGFFVKNLKYT